jgi:Ni,Fe-hydrogenase I cytochrome b subunit
MLFASTPMVLSIINYALSSTAILLRILEVRLMHISIPPLFLLDMVLPIYFAAVRLNLWSELSCNPYWCLNYHGGGGSSTGTGTDVGEPAAGMVHRRNAAKSIDRILLWSL